MTTHAPDVLLDQREDGYHVVCRCGHSMVDRDPTAAVIQWIRHVKACGTAEVGEPQLFVYPCGHTVEPEPATLVQVAQTVGHVAPCDQCGSKVCLHPALTDIGVPYWEQSDCEVADGSS